MPPSGARGVRPRPGGQSRRGQPSWRAPQLPGPPCRGQRSAPSSQTWAPNTTSKTPRPSVLSLLRSEHDTCEPLDLDVSWDRVRPCRPITPAYSPQHRGGSKSQQAKGLPLMVLPRGVSCLCGAIWVPAHREWPSRCIELACSTMMVEVARIMGRVIIHPGSVY